MKLGQKAMEALQAEITGRLRTGDELVVAGPVGFQGTVQLVRENRTFLRQFFSEGFLCDAVRERQFDPEAVLDGCGISALYRLKEGGILAGLWKMAEASQVGLRIDLRRIPIRQETIEICERFDVDPYKLLSGGSILLGCENGQEVLERFQQQGITASVIGRAVSGNDRLLKSGELIRYLDRPGKEQ